MEDECYFIVNNISQKEMEIKNICCIGAGYVGGPTMSVIADNCKSIDVNVVDTNQKRIDSWNSDNLEDLPVFEPGLDEIIKRRRGINLHFSTLVEDNISKADIIFISVNTPTKERGIGAGQASDLKWVEACSRIVAKYAKEQTIVVEKSTVPVRTASVVKSILESNQSSDGNTKKKSFHVLSNPEFLAEGTAIKDLMEPDRVLIGGENMEAINALSNIYAQWIPRQKILYTNIWSSELAKLTANAFLAQRLSSINSISALCEATEANINEVAKAVGSDTRIGNKFLQAGPGFGGSCFKKDILNLVYLCNYFGLTEVGNYWLEVLKLNSWHQSQISNLVIKKLFGTVANKKITILGFAFKANTNDTRESPSIVICKNLLEEGAFLNIHDPKVTSKQIAEELGKKEYKKQFTDGNHPSEGAWFLEKDIKKACKGSDAIIILTDWNEYSQIEWAEIDRIMRKPSWVFDTRSVINKKQIIKTSINFWRIGDGSNH